jgi:hypothetical protein
MEWFTTGSNCITGNVKGQQVLKSDSKKSSMSPESPQGCGFSSSEWGKDCCSIGEIEL